jgi:hypothetical protein
LILKAKGHFDDEHQQTKVSANSRRGGRGNISAELVPE